MNGTTLERLERTGFDGGVMACPTPRCGTALKTGVIKYLEMLRCPVCGRVCYVDIVAGEAALRPATDIPIEYMQVKVQTWTQQDGGDREDLAPAGS